MAKSIFVFVCVWVGRFFDGLVGCWCVCVCVLFDRESIVNSERSSWLSAPKKEAKGDPEKDSQEKDKKAA